MASYKKLIFTAAIFGYITLFAQMLLQVVTLPLIIKHLGKDVVGGYSFILQILGFVTILDFGFSVSLGQGLTQAEAKGSRGELTGVRQAGLTGNAFIGLLYLSVFIVIASFIDRLQSFENFHQDGLRTSLLILGFSSLLKTQFSMFTLSLGSRNQQWLVHLGTLVGVLLRAALFVFVVRIGGGLESIILSYAIADVATVIFHWLVHPRMVLFGGKVNWLLVKDKLKSIVKFGVSFAPMQIASRITYSSDSLVVAVLAGPTVVAAYYSTQMPAFLLFQLLFISTDSFLPQITNLYSSGNHESFAAFARFMLRLSTSLAIGLFFGIVTFNESLISFWVGSELYVGQNFSCLLGVFCALQVLTRPLILFLIATGDMKGWGQIALIGAILKLVLSFALGKLIGVTGVITATVLAEIPLSIILIKKTARIFPENGLNLLKTEIGKFAVYFLLIASTSLLMSIKLPNYFPVFVGKVVLFVILNAISLLVVIMSRPEKDFLKAKILSMRYLLIPTSQRSTEAEQQSQ